MSEGNCVGNCLTDAGIKSLSHKTTAFFYGSYVFFSPILLKKMHLKTIFKALKFKNSPEWSVHFIKEEDSI